MVLAEKARQVVDVALYEPGHERLLTCAFRLGLAPVPMPMESFSVCDVEGVPGRPDEKDNTCHVVSESVTCGTRDIAP